MGCSLKRSALAARRNNSCAANESSGTSPATVGFPFVSVRMPGVFDRAMYDRAKMAHASRNRTPCLHLRHRGLQCLS